MNDTLEKFLFPGAATDDDPEDADQHDSPPARSTHASRRPDGTPNADAATTDADAREGETTDSLLEDTQIVFGAAATSAVVGGYLLYISIPELLGTIMTFVWALLQFGVGVGLLCFSVWLLFKSV